MQLKYLPIDDLSVLQGFRCGIEQMDKFIQNGLADSVQNNYCKMYGVYTTDTNDLVAFFALGFDSLSLGIDYKEDLRDGYTNTSLPHIFSSAYGETFINKLHYPALEITYLAVREDMRGYGIGEACIGLIIDLAKEQTLAGCQFITVDALVTSDYSATGFYYKCRFSQAEDRQAWRDTIRMYYALPKH